jgi:hypothetical protein
MQGWNKGAEFAGCFIFGTNLDKLSSAELCLSMKHALFSTVIAIR